MHSAIQAQQLQSNYKLPQSLLTCSGSLATVFGCKHARTSSFRTELNCITDASITYNLFDISASLYREPVVVKGDKVVRFVIRHASTTV